MIMQEPPTGRTQYLSIILVIFILALLSVIFQGHQFGLGNELEYSAWIFRLHSGGTFLVNDWYLSTPILHPNIVIPLSWLAKVLPLDITFLLAHVFTRLLLCAGVYLLSYSMFSRSDVALLAIVTTILFPRISLGGHYAHAAHFEANFLGFALAVLVIAFLVQGLLDRRFYTYSAITLGVLLNLHFFIGLHLSAIFILFFLFAGRSQRKELIRLIPLTFLLSAPTFIPIFIKYVTQSRILSSREVAEILAFRHPHHHSPFTWHPFSIVAFLYYTLFWLFLHFRYESRGKIVERTIFLYVCITAMVHIIFVELIPLGFVAYLQSFRQTVLFTIFVSLYLAYFIIELIERRHPVAMILAILLVVSFRFPRLFIPISFVVLLLYLIWLKQIPSQRIQLPVFASPGRIYLLSIGSIATVVLLILSAQGYFNPIFHHLLGRDEHFRRTILSPEAELNDVCGWIKTHTPTDAVFIIPPTIEGFRVRAERACVVDFKSMTFTNKEMWEWIDRISRIGQVLRAIGDTSITPAKEEYSRRALNRLHQIRFRAPVEEILYQGYITHTTTDIEHLSRRYGANYFLTFKGIGDYNFRKIYENKKYVLYAIQ